MASTTAATPKRNEMAVLETPPPPSEVQERGAAAIRSRKSIAGSVDIDGDDEDDYMPAVFSWLSVEVPVLLFAFSMGIVTVSSAALLLDQTCNVGSSLFGNGTSYDDTVCDNLANISYREEERYVHEQAEKITYLSSAIQAVPTIVFALLAGAWSDRYGRLFVVLIPLASFIIRDIVFIVISLFEDIAPEFILFETLQDLTGGQAVLMLGAFAHIADISEPKYRTSRMAMLEFCLLSGYTLGNTVGPALFTVASYAPIYVLSIILVLAGIMSIPIFVKGDARRLANDSPKSPIVVVEETSDGYTKTRRLTTMNKLCNLFHPSNIAKTLQCAFRSRPESRRHVIWLLVLCFGAIDLLRSSERKVDSLYLRDEFNLDDANEFAEWTKIFYGIFSACGLLALGIMVPVLKQVYRATDALIVALSVGGSFLRALTFLLATDKSHLYIGALLDVFHISGMVCCRAAVLCLTEPDETGKILGLFAFTQAIVETLAAFAAPLYRAVAGWNENFGLVYCIYATITVIVMVIALYVVRYFRRHKIGGREK